MICSLVDGQCRLDKSNPGLQVASTCNNHPYIDRENMSDY